MCASEHRTACVNVDGLTLAPVSRPRIVVACCSLRGGVHPCCSCFCRGRGAYFDVDVLQAGPLHAASVSVAAPQRLPSPLRVPGPGSQVSAIHPQKSLDAHIPLGVSQGTHITPMTFHSPSLSLAYSYARAQAHTYTWKHTYARELTVSVVQHHHVV